MIGSSRLENHILAETITIDARGIATSANVPRLVVQGTTWSDMIGEVRHVLPELPRLDGRSEPKS